MPIKMTIPTATIKLPSEGKLYPEDHPLTNGEIEFHHMTAREEDILASRSILKQGTLINKLIESCVITGGIDPLKMLSCDRDALLIAIRISGFGANYVTTATCPFCSSTQQLTFDLGGLNVKNLEAEPIKPRTNLFKFQLPVSKYNVTFKLQDGTDELRIVEKLKKIEQHNKRLEESKNQTLLITNEKEITTRLSVLIKEIEGETDENTIAEVVEAMLTLDSRALRDYMEAIEPRVVMKSLVNCKECGMEKEFNIPVTVDFFWPSPGI